MSGAFSGGVGNSNDLPATPLSPEAQAAKDALANMFNTQALEIKVIDPKGANITCTFAPSALMVHLKGPTIDVILPYAIG